MKETEQRHFLRCLMNVRDPGTLSERFLSAQLSLSSRGDKVDEKGPADPPGLFVSP